MPKLEKVRWYLNRFRAMSLSEVGHRFKERWLIEQERLLVRRAARSEPRFSKKVEEVFACFQREDDVRFFFSWCDRERIQKSHQTSWPVEKDATLRAADTLLCHTITLFGKQFELGDKINWSQDPVTKREWPKVFWADVNVRDGQTVGGVKWTRELNRHHHLVTLSKAYFLSGKDRYAEEVCAQLVDWIESNPRYIGVNWASPLGLAIRLINWTWALAFMRHSPALTVRVFKVILQSVAEQASHIARHLSAYSSANNHLIGEAAGLAIVGLCFPWLPHAGQWRDKGLEILTRELELQIYTDGVPAEQAFHYVVFDLDFYLLVWQLARLNGLTVPKTWHDRLGAAFDFVRHVMDEEGNVPSIGDSDDAWVVRLDDRPEVNNRRSILAAAAVLLKRPEFKASAVRWDEKSHWLLGQSDFPASDLLPMGMPTITSRAFKDGGYCVMRTPGRVIVFDCGPLGYLSTAAHGHADALSLTLSLDEQPVLVDPGTFAYWEGDKQRDYFRGTAAHNTVVVDGHNQSEMLGTFLWGHKADTRLLRWESTPNHDLAIAEHNGYAKVGVVHRRTVLFHKPDWILVVDRLQGKGEHSFEQLWHLPANCHVDIGSEYADLAIDDKQFMIISLNVPGASVQTRGTLVQGWVSSRYGQMEPAPVLSFSGRSHLPVQLATVVYLADSQTSTDLSDLTAQMLGILDNLEQWSDAHV